MKELYKVLIVDDEPIAREGLEMSVSWESLGFKLIGSAENGQQAIEIIAEQQPELVITDLAMPEMSGIELIDYVRRHMFYQPKFMILSAYGTFDYAKSAMQLGVDTYILKPVIRTELTKKLMNAKADMDQYKEEQKVRKKTSERLERLSCLYLTWLLNGQAGEEEIHKLEKIWNLNGRPRRILAVKIAQKKDDNRELFMRALRQLGVSTEPYEMVFLTSNFAVIVLDYEGEHLEKVFSKELSVLTDSIHIVMDLGQVGSWKEIRESWKLVGLVMDYCFYRKYKSKTFCIEDMPKLFQKNSSYCREISKMPEQDGLDEVQKVINYCDILQSQNVDPEQFRVSILARVSENKSESAETIRQKIMWMSFEELKGIWIQMLKEKAEECNQENVSGQIENYVRTHFRENITIQDMACELCYNEVYLGRLVKREKGMSFRQYLNKVRMDYAENLLKESMDSVIEIAYRSGFSNPDYFCKKFREKNGMTPTEFRKR